MAEVATQVTVPILDMNMFMSNIKTDFQGKVGPSVTQISGSTYEENKENEGHVEGLNSEGSEEVGVTSGYIMSACIIHTATYIYTYTLSQYIDSGPSSAGQ
uniref:Uncharacterized protein n=1 Tax=Magallana gigas TaxID=29159 RepID=K1Q9X8_MAGGI